MVTIDQLIQKSIEQTIRRELANLEAKLLKAVLSGKTPSPNRSASVSTAQSPTSQPAATSGLITGKMVKARRQTLGLSGKAFAAKVGVALPTVYLWEKQSGVLSLRGKAKTGLEKFMASTSSATPVSAPAAPAVASEAPSPVITGSQVKALRKSIGYSAKEFAKAAGVSIATVFNWEGQTGALTLRGQAKEGLGNLVKNPPTAKAPNKRGRKTTGAARKSTPAPKASDEGAITGAQVAANRKALGLSAAQYAKKAGVSLVTVYKWEGKKGVLKLRGTGRASLQKLLQEKPETAPAAAQPKTVKAASAQKKAAGKKKSTAQKPAAKKSAGKKSSGKASKAPAPSDYKGSDVKAFREKLGISARALADKAGVSLATIYNWETTKGLLAPRGNARVALDNMMKG